MTRLFHVSDIHFGAEDRAALDWFRAKVDAEQPDAVVLTGDLTMRARPREFEAAAAWIESLGTPVTIEVGNHDLPYFDLMARLFSPYRRIRAIEERFERPLDLPGVEIVPLKTTARVQFRLNWSKGHVSDGALGEALRLVDAASPESVLLVTAHHPLVEAGTIASSRTRGGRRALEKLAAAGVHAVLTGHVHDPFDMVFPVGDRTVRLIGAGTLSERVRSDPPSFNEVRVEQGEIAVTRAAWARRMPS